MQIRSATIADTAAIQHIACLTWPVAYADILSPQQMQYMLHKMYDLPVLQKQMEEEDHLFFIAEQDGNMIGFAGTSPDAAHSREGRKAWKLHKLYVLPAVQRSGAGKALMNTVIQTAKENGAHTLTLNVNRDNPAYQYYLSKGFEVIETGDFDIGEGFFMNDYVMSYKL